MHCWWECNWFSHSGEQHGGGPPKIRNTTTILSSNPFSKGCQQVAKRHMRGDPPKHRIYLQKFCIYSYRLEIQSSSKYSAFDAIHLSRHFFHCSEQFLNSLHLMPVSASAVFCFTSSTLAICFPLRTFFIWGNKKKCHQG